ncbi:MAG: electron transfer flavoprotein subunit beta/FixA family protein [Anaerolineales bacterium]
MVELSLIVCMKVVPKSEEIRVDPDSMRLDRSDVRSEMNPPDMNAIELALRLKDRHGGHVTILSMGPPFVEPYLRVALAMGGDHIVLLSDRKFGGADTLATTYSLAQGIRKIGGANLIICGEESSDGATGQVPAGIAEWLDLPQLTVTQELTFDAQTKAVRGRRETAGGHQILEVPTPAVVSVATAANEPRFMDYRIKPWTMQEERITVWDAEDLEVDEQFIGVEGSPTIVSGLKEAAKRERKGINLTGSVDDIGARVADLLRDHVTPKQ